MADIELVIKIPKELYDYSKNMIAVTDKIKYAQRGILLEAIKNGTPLPKWHGRLGDLNALANKMCMAYIGHLESEAVAGLMLRFCNKAPTIIEADKVESEDKYGD